MRSKSASLFILLALAVLIVSGCNEDTAVPECSDKSETLRNYLIDNDMDLPELLADCLIEANAVHGNEAAYHVMDIRSEGAYDQGHIPGAVLSSLTSILADAVDNNGKPIVVVCYTGQTAGYAVMALRLSGYSDARVLKFGMSSWHSHFDFWTTNCADIGIGHPNWIEPPGNIEADEEHSYPSISVCTSDGASILAERVTEMLKGGFKGINGSEVLNTPAGYFINIYWLAGDVVSYGNISGSRRIYPMSLVNGELSFCEPGAMVVSYSWTGHTSSMITAYLTVLGYKAVSLRYGVNGMIHANLTSNKWNGSFDYTYEETNP